MRPFRHRSRREIQARRAAMFVRQDGCAFGHVRLSRHPVRQPETAARRPRFDRAQDRRVVSQFQPEEVGRDLARDVVRRRTQAAGDEDDLRLSQRLRDRVSDHVTIGDGGLTFDPQTERKDFARDERQMGIENVAEKKLCAGIDEDGDHVEALKRYKSPPALTIQRFNAVTSRAPARDPYAASLSCFFRISGSFFPSTTARLIVTSAMSSRLGTSYMISSMIRSSMERRARAPVPFVTACAASAFKASFVTLSRTPSIENSFVYCLIIAFFVSVRIATISSSVSASSALSTGRRPMNSGIIPKLSKSSGSTWRTASLASAASTSSVGLLKPIVRCPIRFWTILSRPTNAPPQMKRIFSVFTWLYSWSGCLRPPCGGTLQVLPPRILRSACCTPSPETSRVMLTLSVLRPILSISSM